MRYSIIDAPQKTVEWLQARAGRVTSSKVDCIFMQGRKKNEESKTRADYRLRLALERVNGTYIPDEYVNADMQRGNELEPAAIAAVEANLGILTESVGFLSCDELPVGTSPDAIVRNGDGIDMVIEVKCPKLTTHYDYLKNPDLLWDTYAAQCRHHLWVSNAFAIALASYCPQFASKPLLVVQKSALMDLDAHELAVRLFLDEVEREMDEIRKLTEAA